MGELDLSKIADEKVGYDTLVGSLWSDNVGFGPVKFSEFIKRYAKDAKDYGELYKTLETSLAASMKKADSKVDTKQTTVVESSLVPGALHREKLLHAMLLVREHYL